MRCDILHGHNFDISYDIGRQSFPCDIIYAINDMLRYNWNSMHSQTAVKSYSLRDRLLSFSSFQRLFPCQIEMNSSSMLPLRVHLHVGTK